MQMAQRHSNNGSFQLNRAIELADQDRWRAVINQVRMWTSTPLLSAMVYHTMYSAIQSCLQPVNPFGSTALRLYSCAFNHLLPSVTTFS